MRLLNDAILAKKRPLAVSFVHACIDARTLVDEGNHILERPANSKGVRSKPSPQKPPFSLRNKKPKRVPPASIPAERSRLTKSPTPPPKVVKSGWRNLYTDDEHQFFRRYIRWAYRGDPDLTVQSLTQQLAAKVSCDLSCG